MSGREEWFNLMLNLPHLMLQNTIFDREKMTSK